MIINAKCYVTSDLDDIQRVDLNDDDSIELSENDEEFRDRAEKMLGMPC